MVRNDCQGNIRDSTGMIVSPALSAIGNRAWGSGYVPHWVGLAVMSIGCWIGKPLWTLPIFAAMLYIWRFRSPRPWFALYENSGWAAALVRGLWIMPYAGARFLFDMWWGHLVLGILAIASVPACYWLASRQTKYDRTAIAECLSGALVGCI